MFSRSCRIATAPTWNTAQRLLTNLPRQQPANRRRNYEWKSFDAWQSLQHKVVTSPKPSTSTQHRCVMLGIGRCRVAAGLLELACRSADWSVVGSREHARATARQSTRIGARRLGLQYGHAQCCYWPLAIAELRSSSFDAGCCRLTQHIAHHPNQPSAAETASGIDAAADYVAADPRSNGRDGTALQSASDTIGVACTPVPSSRSAVPKAPRPSWPR